MLGVLVGVPSASATTGDIGYLDQSFSGVSNAPTSDKPQSKLWYVDGFWWAIMFDSVSKTWHIFRLDRSSEHWTDTGVKVDGRVNTLPDALWDGSHLYIASHVVAYSTDTSPQASTTNNPARLYRFSYSSATKTFTSDAGFPTVINNNSSESLTIDEDSTGIIWASWTQVSGDATNGWHNTVYANAASGGGTSWGTPFVMPSNGTGLAPDDISAVVAFGKNKIGVMWSNQVDETVYWGVHDDGAAVGSWRIAPAIRGNKQADDHMNLKAIQADPSGRVFAAVKTSADEVPGATSTDPQLLLLAFKPGTGSWSSTVVGTLADCHTRPQVVLDEQHSIVHVLATAPSGSGCPAAGTPGTIYEKSAPLDNPVFPAGRGTPIIRDAASAQMNNVTTTKQPVNGASGMVALAGNVVTSRYWHADVSLGGGADASAPSTPTGFTASAPGSSQVNLAWTSSIDNVGVTGYRVYRNGGSTPVATLAASATSYSDTAVAASTAYTYQVSAVDAAGNESGKVSASVTTPAAGTPTPTPTPTGSGTFTFAPTEDASVDSSAPSTNFGSSDRLNVDGSPASAAVLKFNVTGTTGCAVSSAKLRLTVGSGSTDGSPYGGDVYAVSDNSWSESTVTWNTKPAAGTTKIASRTSSVALNTAYTWDVTSLVKGDGQVSMQVATANSDAARYWSKDGSTAAQAPQLQVTCGSSPVTTAFKPTADASVDSSTPSTNSGSSNRLTVDGSPPVRRCFGSP